MSVIADFSLPADAFALGELLEVRSGIQVELETMVPTEETLLPYFWVDTADAGAIESALNSSPLVDAVVPVEQLGDDTLFRVAWTDEIDGLLEAIANSDGVVLDGTGYGDEWAFQLRFPDKESLSQFYRTVVADDVKIDLTSVHEPIETAGDPAFELTAEQQEVLTLALEQGYFDVPRDVTLVELAEMLHISDSAVSQRIRRGLTTILSATLEQHY